MSFSPSRRLPGGGKTIPFLNGGAMLSYLVCLGVGIIAGLLFSSWKQRSHCKDCGMDGKCEDFY
jgi:hypothetical protein